MKILIVADNYYPNVNGCSYFAQRLAFYLKKRGYEVLVMAPSRSLNHERYSHDGVDIFGVRSFSLGFIYTNFRFCLPFGNKNAIEKEMKRFRPDVIHIQDHFVISPVVQKIAKDLNIPMMGTNHFMPENVLHYLHLPKKLENMVRNWAWGEFRKVFEELHVVTTPTKTAAGLLKEVKLTKPVLAVSNGVDLQKFKPENNGDYLKKRLNIPNAPVLLYVGRLDKEKNLDLVLRALAGALKKTQIHFVIAGKGAEMDKLKKLAQALGIAKSVTFTGFIPDEDLPHLYTIADCFIIAGIAELQSLVTMEAMATRLPVVAVNAMALPELVKHNENGFLFEHNDTESLTRHLVEIFSNSALRKKMGEKSLEYIQTHDINRSLLTFETLYKNLAEKNI